MPVISLAALITSPTRALNFWEDMDGRKTIFLTLCALPAVVVVAISALLGVVRTNIHAGFSALPSDLVFLSVIIGSMTTPGALA